MKLTVKKRQVSGKGQCKRIRRAGNIPAILYSGGKEGEALEVSGSDYEAALRQMKKGHLPTTVFNLVDEEGNERRAIVKDIQYHVTTYDVLHLDFEELKDDVMINVNVPVECIGVADCAGIKLGGVLRRVIRHARVRGYPKDIPAAFEIDVRHLGMKESLRLSDIEMPDSIRPLIDTREVAVTIAKR